MRKTGRKAASDWLHIFTVRGGKVVAFLEFTDTAAFAQAWKG
jgi:ketosteroid isomerase-like protein